MDPGGPQTSKSSLSLVRSTPLPPSFVLRYMDLPHRNQSMLRDRSYLTPIEDCIEDAMLLALCSKTITDLFVHAKYCHKEKNFTKDKQPIGK